MYTLKSVARRVTAFGAASAIIASAVFPSVAVVADALNPLTKRSLLLSSSAPGFQNTDGSGNATYAPPGSGPNGQKTGETFTFNVSTDSVATNKPIEAITLQYCTSAAGNCQAPGDNAGDFRDGLLDVGDPAYSTPNTYDVNDDLTNNGDGRELNSHGHPQGRSDLDVVGAFTAGTGAGQFEVFVNNVSTGTDWTMTTENAEDPVHRGSLTGKKNLIRLIHTDGGIQPTFDDEVRIVFRADDTRYITNPGSGAFFVKINTYQTDDPAETIPTVPYASNTNIIDGGVTVANVMTDSIHITTKVLETMAFSVGTRNRDTVTLNCVGGANPATGCEGVSGYAHGTCDPIQQINNNQLQLGDPDAEYSLETGKAWSVYSYWRLSSNSSGGATVYYSGNTLANTVGDEIRHMPTEAASNPGTEQFGLGFASTEAPSAEYLADQPGRDIDSFPFRTLATQTSGKFDILTLPSQAYTAEYDEAQGTNVGGTDSTSHVSNTAKFKFNKASLTVPEPIAQQNDQVISCATARMRYVGNIAADTPAGVYTTKINYLAAPQY
jgi:hypothetical protein